MKQFKKDDTVMLLIDHQVGTLNFTANRPHEMIISRTRALAKLAKALGIPVVLTSSQEDHAQGPLIDDLKEILPEEFENRVKRAGITNAWDDDNYKQAVLKAADSRKNVIMAGLTNDVCIVWPSISMQEEGFDIQVVIDAGGSPSQIADDIAKQTWESQGVRTTTINQLISELVHNWATEEGQQVLPIMFEEVMSKVGKFS
ncbi:MULTISPECIES: isochorismatase family protein [Chryseobacterium]|uniref:isochorismatase family protein n=1 Tax=Chryseobacterium TaxID=59732 RepID=UPI000FAFFAA1|nr:MULTISPECIES: isochorismatase family protein [Chryseobacterium]MBM7419493.1 nicotinamidase-related amidase [Chryseobacterium sp. JUb44]MCD0477721.1 isochorismatase family protein [Chryseobacterium sp. LC2016-29]MDH6209422.1 nicotinamidase-related amidase [Chryseobacterium sp. BIGb0186]WSO12256.1 isochorismatase family protein [Chryseobacterium scophthalmum]